MFEGWKEILGAVTILMTFIGTAPYFFDVLKGKTRPHLYTYLIWSIVVRIAFLGQITSGGGPGAWVTGAIEITTLVYFVLCFKYGTEDVTFQDSIFLVGALIAIVPWIITKDPLLSVILATVIDILACIPTIQKSYNDPESETLSTWALTIPRQFISILALSTYSITTLVYPIGGLFINAIVIVGIIIRRRAFVV